MDVTTGQTQQVSRIEISLGFVYRELIYVFALQSQIAQHDEPIKCVKWFEMNGQGMLGESRQTNSQRNLESKTDFLSCVRSQ